MPHQPLDLLFDGDLILQHVMIQINVKYLYLEMMKRKHSDFSKA